MNLAHFFAHFVRSFSKSRETEIQRITVFKGVGTKLFSYEHVGAKASLAHLLLLFAWLGEIVRK